MRYGIISDIHAYADRLEAALRVLEGEKTDTLVCLGDIVGYGPDPIQTFDLVKRHIGLKNVVRGNHDHEVGFWIDTSMGYITWDQYGHSYHARMLGPAAQVELSRLPFTLEIDGATLAHASIPEPEKWRYVEFDECDEGVEAVSAEVVFSEMAQDLLFVAHSHFPGYFVEGNNKNTLYRACEPERSSGSRSLFSPILPGETIQCFDTRVIVDVGSVSIPRRLPPVRTAVVYDSSLKTVRFLEVPEN